MERPPLSVEPDLTQATRKRNRFVIEALERRFGPERVAASALSVLDLGCGRGELAEALGQAGVGGVYGIDFDREAVAAARRRCGRYGHRFEVLSVEDFDASPVYDAVVIADVLPSLRDPRAALRAVRRWVQPGGLLAVTLPNGYGPWAYYRLWVERRAGLPRRSPRSALGRHRFSGRSLARLVAAAGFRIERWRPSNFLSPVYPFSVSRYRPLTLGFIERWDLRVADLLPRTLASGWYLSLLPAAVPEAAPGPAARRAAAVAWSGR